MAAVKTILPTQNLINNCQGYWNCKGNSNDNSVNGNNLTQVNTPVFITGQPYASEEAVDLEYSSSQYLNIADGDQTGLDITGDISIAFLVNVESFANWIPCVSKYKSTGNDKGYLINFNTSNLLKWKISTDGSTTDLTLDSVMTFDVNIWYFIVCVLDVGTGAYIYVNGELDAEDTSSIPAEIYDNAAGFNIGSSDDGGISYADAKFAEVGVFDCVMTAEEVRQLFAMVAYKMYMDIDGQYKARKRSLDFLGAV